MPSITKWLILVNIGVYLLEMRFGSTLVAIFALWPPGSHYSPELQTTVGFAFWQVLTSAFLHGGPAHLALNMWGLYMFGKEVETRMGAASFAGLYSAAVLTASVVQLAVVTAASGPAAYPTLGASGGVFGVLLAYGFLFPKRTILLLIPPIPLPARVFVVFYGILELTNGVLGTQEGVAHFAHLGGMLGGYVVLRIWKKRSQSTRPGFGRETWLNP